jgi:hypothetical protein
MQFYSNSNSNYISNNTNNMKFNINNNNSDLNSFNLNANKNFDSNMVYGYINEKNKDPFNFVDDMLKKK